MTNDLDTGDSAFDGKHLKGRFKDALSRTRSKFHKQRPERDSNGADYKLSQDVNDFLAAGRTNAAPPQPPRPSPARGGYPQETSPVPSPNHSSTDLPRPHASPRGVSVPRLDVSQTSRWPEARPVEDDMRAHSREYLRPVDTSSQRSQSLSSFKKKRPRLRNLSVSFDSKPPVIIGLGGDEAEQPTVEISRLRQRARSLSPIPPNRPGSRESANSQSSQSSIKRKPLPTQPIPNPVPNPGLGFTTTTRSVNPSAPAAQNPFGNDDDPDFVPKPLVRAPTGASDLMRPADKEFEMSLQTPDSASDDSDVNQNFKTELFSPKPMRPPVAPPEAPSEAISESHTGGGNQHQHLEYLEHRNHERDYRDGQAESVNPFDAEKLVGSTPLKPGAVRVTIANTNLPPPPPGPPPSMLREPKLPNVQVPVSNSSYIPPPSTAGRPPPPPVPPRRHPITVGGEPMVQGQQPPLLGQSTMPRQVAQGPSPGAHGVLRMQTMGHRKKPSLNETETMQQGANGWL